MRSVFSRSLCLLPVLLLAACGGNGSEPPNYIEYQGQVYVAGDLSGQLREEIPAVFKNITLYDGNASDKPVFVSADSIAQFDDATWQGLQNTYNNLIPIILVDADQSEINTFLSKLKIDSKYILPRGFDYAEFFAVDMEPGGHQFQWSSHPPIIDETEDMDTSAAEFRFSLDQNDNSDAQVERVDNFRTWLAQDNNRMSSVLTAQQATSKIQATAKAAASDIDDDLVSMAQAFAQSYTVSIKADNGKHNYYQVNYYIYSCHLFGDTYDSSSDWIYVIENSILNSGNGYAGSKFYPNGQHAKPGYISFDTRPADYEGLFAERYEMNHFIPVDNQDGKDNPLLTDVELMASNPDNINNTETATTKINYNIGGNVGFKGSTPNATISAGVNITNEKTVEVKDVTIENNSLSNVNNAEWKYTMKFPEQVAKWDVQWYGKLQPPTSLSISAFQPSNQWIWKLPYSIRAKTASPIITSHIKIVLDEAGGGKAGNPSPVLAWADLSDPYVFDQHVHTLKFYVPFSYPPAFVPPDDINLSSAGQTVYPTIYMTGSWNGTCDKDWCHIDDPADSTSETVHLTVDPNTTGTQRQATITFSTSDKLYTGTTMVYQSEY